jgi:hypothetical protein
MARHAISAAALLVALLLFGGFVAPRGLDAGAGGGVF